MRPEIDAALPPGTARAEVERFLDERGLEWSYVARERTVYALVKDAGGTAAVKRSFQLKFRLDEEGRLARYTIEEGWTGP